MRDRTVRILELLTDNKNVKVITLAELLDVSQVTLRRDLDNLEKLGIINRSHGYASLNGTGDISRRMAFYYSIKRGIAKAAVETIEDGETVMLESGSCCALFAEELALVRKNITIVTNSVYIANFIRRFSNIKIILLGGYLQPESQVLIGPLVIKNAQNLFTDKLFIGADGFIPGQSFTGNDHLRAETAMGLANCVNKVFILTESAKFYHRGCFNLLDLNKITGVFTDEKIPAEAEAVLQKNNIKLCKVPAVDENIKWRHRLEQCAV